MTSSSKIDIESDRFNCLILSYTHFDFLLDKDQIYSSVTFEKSVALDATTHPYLKEAIEYKNQLVPILELSHYLGEFFHCINENTSNIILIIKIKTVATSQKLLLQKMHAKHTLHTLSQEYIGLRANSCAVMQKIHFSQLHLTPHCLRKKLWPKGVMAVRFLSTASTHKIQYLLDVERIVFDQIVPVTLHDHNGDT